MDVKAVQLAYVTIQLVLVKINK